MRRGEAENGLTVYHYAYMFSDITRKLRSEWYILSAAQERAIWFECFDQNLLGYLKVHHESSVM